MSWVYEVLRFVDYTYKYAKEVHNFHQVCDFTDYVIEKGWCESEIANLCVEDICWVIGNRMYYSGYQIEDVIKYLHDIRKLWKDIVKDYNNLGKLWMKEVK